MKSGLRPDIEVSARDEIFGEYRANIFEKVPVENSFPTIFQPASSQPEISKLIESNKENKIEFRVKRFSRFRLI